MRAHGGGLTPGLPAGITTGFSFEEELPSFRTNPHYCVVVRGAVFNEVVHTAGTAVGEGVNLLAFAACGILLCRILLLARCIR
jgi:hypothetical protein